MTTIVNDRDVILSNMSPRSILDASTINIVLSAPIIVVSTDSLGAPTSYANTGTTINVFKSGVPLSYGTGPNTYSVTSYAAVPAGAASLDTATSSGNTYTVPGISLMSTTIDSVLITYTVNVRDVDGTSVDFYTSQVLNKAKSGSSGRTVNLTATTQAFTYTAAGNSPSPASSTITALAVNTTGTVYYEFLVGTTTVQNSTTSTYTYTPSATTTSMPQQLTVKIRENGASTAVVAINTLSMLASAPGADGTPGARSITINAFAWGTSKPASTAAITYTWATGTVSAYPVGWTASAAASTTTGQTLYMISLIITDSTGSAATTVTNWSSATSGTVGYRQDGSIGPQGNSARVAYYVTTSASPPSTPSSSGDSAPSGWSFTATATLSEGYYMYQSDGLLGTTNITWGVPYLSNLKVGSLSALSANLGTVSISTVGSVSSSGKSYGSGDGFFLGYSGGYKFDVGNSSKYLRWNGSSIELNGDIVGASNIDITGKAIFSGQVTGFGFASTMLVNVTSGFPGLGIQILNPNNVSAAVGVYAAFSSSQPLIQGYNTGSGAGISGSATTAGAYGVHASGQNGAYALRTNPAGSVFEGQIVSTAAQGVSPLEVASTTVCNNLTAYQATRVYNNGGEASLFVSSNINVVLQPDSNFVQYKNGVAYWVAPQNQSDIRLKNLVNTEVQGLSIINKLGVVNYTWKDSSVSKTPGAIYTGLIAQEVEKVIPTAVTIIKDTYLLDKTEIIPFLVKAVQELHIKVTELETQIGIKNG